MMNAVKAWKETVVIPTYEIGKPEKNPIFLEKRIYQGSSGSVYPHPVIEKISDEKIDKEWNAIYIENQYLKIMILPELGGRVQMAFDKTKQRHFIYYNQVIKPALVGLTGPWISGGIEFNWPQHHRPSTYQSVDSVIEENSDGSITVWCSEIERMFRTKGMAGFTLHPEKAYLEIIVKLYNRTPHPQTFLWWANPAVKVNDDYQSVFPPDVNAVFDHGKRDVSEFPIAKGTYYKVDYSPGTDISRYKNIPVPTSYMAINSKYNFVGGFENDSKGGLLHVANHHISPGKKQWTWGHGDFGRAWDRNLTDEDGPYIELMCGVYTDNQPDFSWLMPYEEKSFSQYFMPYRNLGVVKNATKEAMINLEIENGKALVKAYTLASYPFGKVILKSGSTVLLEDEFNFHPATSYEKMIELKGADTKKLEIIIQTSEGKTLVDWKTDADEKREIPKAAKAAKLPEEIESIEELYLNGLHLEQYRHATYDPRDYYLEALKRDPHDSRCNNAMGLWLLRRGKFQEAETYFRTAVETLTQRNPNPIDGEPLFNLGLTLRFQEKNDEAFDAFYKSVWNAAWMDSGYFQLAQLCGVKKDWEHALEVIDKSLIRNWHNHKARHLKVAILRKLGDKKTAFKLADESLDLDNFNFGVLFEKQLLQANTENLTNFKLLISGNIHNYIEIALDYYWAGMYEEGIAVLDLGIEQRANVFPMALYYKGWLLKTMGDLANASKAFKLAAKANPEYCFPNQLESVLALNDSIRLNPEDFYAPFYLGNFWYAARQYKEAMECWSQSGKLNSEFPTVHRNLALAFYNKKNDSKKALFHLEKAYELDACDARILMELDQLYKKLNKSFSERIELLENACEISDSRDDVYLEKICLYNSHGDHEKAFDLLMSRTFHPWEGGEGKVVGQYILALVELAKKEFKQKNFAKAMELLERAKIYPHNLGEGKLIGSQENDINYLIGCCYEGQGEFDLAQNNWKLASEGLDEPEAAIFYNDQQPDKIFYQGLALLKLERQNEANSRFNKLIGFGEKHLADDVKLDYFAVSLPDLQIWEDDLNKRNQIHCHYLIGLGKLGLGNKNQAKAEFEKVMEMDINHLGAFFHLKMMEQQQYS